MSETNHEANCIEDARGNGYGVFQFPELHKRAHLWRIDSKTGWHSIATFHSDDEALAFLRWLRERTVTR
jgi:hypothetical protein